MTRIACIFALIAAAAIAATFLYPIFMRDHEGISRINAETNAIGGAIQQYKERFGVYPEGTTAEICKALIGTNKGKVVFLDFPAKIISQNGSFKDPWGTPYEIFISESGPLIRSAGKDHVFSEGYVKGSDDFYAW